MRKPKPKPKTDHVSIEIYQQDWLPGFGAFRDDGQIDKNAKAHVVLSLAGLLSVVDAGELTKEELPYMVADVLMHEIIHVLEAWAKVEFSEEKVDALLDAYRKKYPPPEPSPKKSRNKRKKS